MAGPPPIDAFLEGPEEPKTRRAARPKQKQKAAVPPARLNCSRTRLREWEHGEGATDCRSPSEEPGTSSGVSRQGGTIDFAPLQRSCPWFPSLHPRQKRALRIGMSGLLPLAMAALKRRAGNERAVCVAFDDDGKRDVLHRRIIVPNRET